MRSMVEGAAQRPAALPLRPAALSAKGDGMQHDIVLIVDFGSQVTQLIARRVREAGVYCEIHPFSRAGEAFARLEAQGGDPLRRAGFGAGSRQPARAGGDFRQRRADSRHLLRPADALPAARRQGRGRPCGGVRPRRRRDRRRSCALFEGVWAKGQRYPVWMSHGDRVTRLPRWLSRLRRVGERPLRGRGGREAPLLHDHVPPRSGPHARRREADRQLPA